MKEEKHNIIKKSIQEILSKDYNVLIVDNEENDIALYISLKDISIVKLSIFEDSPRNMWVEELYVNKSFRNKGFAKHIMNSIPSIAKCFQCTFLTLFVKKDTWIHNWYKHLGYIDYATCDSDKTYMKCIKIINNDENRN